MKFISILYHLNILFMIFLQGKSWIISRLNNNHINSNTNIIKSIKYNSLYSSKSDDNYGIKSIYNSKDVAIIWKASNVGVFINDSVYRPAAISVEEWIQQEYISNHSITNKNIDDNNLNSKDNMKNNVWKPTMIISNLSVETSGLILIALNKNVKEFLENHNTFIEYTYTVVVQEMKSKNKNNNDTIDNDLYNNNNNNSSSSNNDNISIISSKNSEKYGKIHIIKIRTSCIKHSSEQLDSILQLCHNNNYAIIDSMISLTDIHLYELSSTIHNHNHTSNNNTTNNIHNNNYTSITNTFNNIIQLPINFKVDTPKKFIKFMNREEILYNRKNKNNIIIEQIIIKTDNYNDKMESININNSSNNRNNSNKPPNNNNVNYNISVNKIMFNRLEFLYPSIDSLEPRISSEVLVHTCIEYIHNLIISDNMLNNNNTMQSLTYMPAILDLGTASGALLISILSNYVHNNNHNNNNTTRSHNSIGTNRNILGVGIDINDKALFLASCNAHALLSTNTATIYNNSSYNDNKELNITLGSDSNYNKNSNSSNIYELSTINTSSFQDFNLYIEKSNVTCMFQHNNYKDLDRLHQKLLLQLQVKEYNGFDIIICNPPYLSHKANRNRISMESKLALVAGESGYEAYDEICHSIRTSINNNNNNNNNSNNNKKSQATAMKKQEVLIESESDINSSSSSNDNRNKSNSNTTNNGILKPKGYVIFQISAAEKALFIIKNILKKYQFNIIAIKLDQRGIRRCIVAIAC